MARTFEKNDATVPHVRAWALLTEARAANPTAGATAALVTGALPGAAVGYEGLFWYVAGSGGTTPGQLYFCAKTSAGGYEWITVGATSV
jgi:hypothetical protein